jgi:FolB domain-containing protein
MDAGTRESPLNSECFELFIPKLRLWVSLGCNEGEKDHLQPVDVDIKIEFLKEPIGCKSDQITDVHCYKTLSDKLVKAVESRSFNLIESLAAHLFEVAATFFYAEECIIEIAVEKPYHLIFHVGKGISFKYRKRNLHRDRL